MASLCKFSEGSVVSGDVMLSLECNNSGCRQRAQSATRQRWRCDNRHTMKGQQISVSLTGISIRLHELLNDLLVLCPVVRSTSGDDCQLVEPRILLLFVGQ